MSNQYPKTAHTRGTTFTRLGMSTLPAGTWSIAAKVYTGAGVLVETLGALITALPTPDADGHTHAWSITSDASETALWPLAALMLEVRFTDTSNPAVVVPAVSRTINCSAYTLPSTDADDPLAVITDALAPVLRGEPGPAGAASTVPGPAGDDGVGVPAGGTTGQVLAKKSATNYDTEWVDPASGGGSGATNLAYTASATQGVVTSDTGTDATIPAADGTNAGLMAPAQHSKLAALPSSADPAGTAASAVAAHAAASDPHPGYALESALATVATSGSYADLSSKPTLGTAAALDVPSSGDATSGQVVKGSDSRLTDARTPSAHTHPASAISDSTATGRAVVTAVDAAAARTAIGAGTSSFDGAYASLSGKPTLGDAAAKNTGTTTGTVAAGDDSRLSNSRAPTAHKTSHATGGSDALAASDIGAAPASLSSRAVTILLPVTNDEVTLFRAKSAMTITKLVAVGGGFTYTVRKAADRSATGTEVVTGGSTVTSTTTGDVVTSFNSASIAADDWVWIKLTSVTGTPASFNLTMEF